MIVITISSKNVSSAYLKSNQRQWVEYVSCDKTDECPLYANGKCACYRYFLGKDLICPNGKWHRLVGYTKRAKAFSEFADMAREKYKATAEEYNKKICVVADYVYIPLPFLSGAENKFKGVEDGRVINDHFVKIEDFDEEMIEELVKFVPRTWLDSTPIKSYRDEYIPQFIQQLKEEMPTLYMKWKSKYPETSDKYNGLSPVGRTAYISTMPDGMIDGWKKTGNILSKDNGKEWAFSGRFSSKQPLKITVEINDDMVVKITEDMVTDENTRFID